MKDTRRYKEMTPNETVNIQQNCLCYHNGWLAHLHTAILCSTSHYCVCIATPNYLSAPQSHVLFTVFILILYLTHVTFYSHFCVLFKGYFHQTKKYVLFPPQPLYFIYYTSSRPYFSLLSLPPFSARS